MFFIGHGLLILSPWLRWMALWQLAPFTNPTTLCYARRMALEYYDGLGDPLSSFGFDAVPTTQTAPQKIEVRNAGIADVTSIKAIPKGYLSATPSVILTGKGQGMVALDTQAFRIARFEAFDGTEIHADTPFGFGAAYDIGDLAAGASAFLELTLIYPLNGTAAAFHLLIDFNSQASVFTGETQEQGVAIGAGDGTMTALYLLDGEIAEVPASESDIAVPDAIWVAGGRYVSRLAAPEVVDDVADDGALIAGETYGFRLTGAQGGLSVIKGLAVVGSAAYPTDFPAFRANELPFGWGVRSAAGEGDISFVREGPGVGFHQATASGLDVTIAGGRSTVGPMAIDTAGTITVPVADDATSGVYVLEDFTGASTTDGKKPPGRPRAMLVANAVAVAGVVTLTDRRAYHRPAKVVELDLGILQEGGVHYWTNPGTSALAIRPWSVVAWIDLGLADQTIAPTLAASDISYDLLIDGVSVFPGGRAPTFAWDSSATTATGFPESPLVIPPGSRLSVVMVRGATGAGQPQPPRAWFGVELDLAQ